jgi:hypothetical protein
MGRSPAVDTFEVMGEDKAGCFKCYLASNCVHPKCWVTFSAVGILVSYAGLVAGDVQG